MRGGDKEERGWFVQKRKREREREENERSESNTVFGCGRASRKIDKIDKIAVRCSRLNCQLVLSIHWTIRIQDAGSSGGARNSVGKRTRDANASYDASWMKKIPDCCVQNLILPQYIMIYTIFFIMFSFIVRYHKKICNCINLTVTTLWCKVAIIRRAKEFQDKELFVAENVTSLNDFMIENTDSADSQTNSTFQHSAVKVSGFGKFLTSFFTRLFLETEPSVYFGKARLGDAGTRRWKRGAPSFVICLRSGVVVYRRKMYLFEMKCASSEWLLDRLSCVPRSDVN